MSIKKIVKVLGVLAVLGVAVAQAGPPDYGIAKTSSQSAPMGPPDYGIAK